MTQQLLRLAQIDPLTLLYILLGGFLPALLWLWFWLKEDRAHPEPRALLLLSFVGGCAAVILALMAQNFLYSHGIPISGWSIILYVATEELAKVFFVWVIALRSRADDEPIDPMIYLIAGALGFAALENTFFVSSAILEDTAASSIATGVLRFLGATLLHVISSGAVGACLGFSFYASRGRKFIAVCLGLTSAIMLHTLFNLLIIKHEGLGVLMVFAVVWIAVLGLILCFERVKKIYPKQSLYTPTTPSYNYK